MASKTDRIEMRATPEQGERISEAARIKEVSVSAFALDAASLAADRVLARAGTLMPADQFDDFIAALDVPDEAPTLTKAAQKRRRFTRP